MKFINDKKTYNALVIGCDLDVGITIVNKENHDEFLLCINGRLSPVLEDGTYDPKEFIDGRYEKLHNYTVTCIERGVLDADEWTEKYGEIYNGAPGFPDKNMCPFGQ